MNTLKKSQPLTPPRPSVTAKGPSLLKTPDAKQKLRVASNDRFLGKSNRSTNAKDRGSVDSNGNKYSITYLPGATEHAINTGSNLEEAQMKVVLLACEVERLTASNYELVKENEVLRVQFDKGQREKDLENKLAIVLAENEKLNQVIEELYELYMSDKADGEGNDEEGAEDYERKIADLIQDLEDWKQRCNSLETRNGGVNFGGDSNTIILLQQDNQRLSMALQDLERQMDAIRNGREQNFLEGKIILLVEENAKLKEELRFAQEQGGEKVVNLQLSGRRSVRGEQVKSHGMRRPNIPGMNAEAFGPDDDMKMQDLSRENEELRKYKADADKLKDTVNVLLGDNERLHALVEKQMKDLQDSRIMPGSATPNDNLRNKIELLAHENERLNQLIENQMREINNLKGSGDLRSKMEILANENGRLNQLLEKQMRDLSVGNLKGNDAFMVKIDLLANENDRLNQLLREKLEEIEKLRKRGDNNAKLEELNGKLNVLADRNNQLTTLLMQKDKEIETFRRNSMLSADGEGDLRTKLLLSNQENDRLSAVVNDRSQELEKLRKQLIDLQGEKFKADQAGIRMKTLADDNERLAAIIRDKSKECEELRIRINELGDSNRVIEDLKLRLNLLASENDKLNTILMERMSEMENLRRQHGEASAGKWKLEEMGKTVDVHRAELDRLNALLVEKAAEVEKLKNRIRELESSSGRMIELEERVRMGQMENDRLNGNIREKNQENSDLRMRVIQLEGTERALEEMKNKMIMMGGEIDRLRTLLSQKDAEIEGLKRRVSTDQSDVLRSKIQTLTNDNERLNGLVMDKYRENEDLRRNSTTLEVGKGDLTFKLDSLERELERVRNENTEKDKELANLRKRVSELELVLVKIRELESVLEGLKGENSVLRKVIEERERVVQELDGKLRVAGSEATRHVETIEALRGESAAAKAALENELARSKANHEEKIKLERRRSQSERDNLEKRTQELNEETDKLRTYLSQVLSDLEVQKRKYAELESLKHEEVEDFKNQFDILKEINREIKDLQLKSAAERTAYEIQISQYEMTLGDMERQRALIVSENERLNNIMMQRSEETSKMRRKVTQSEESYRLEVSELRSQLEQYKANAYDIKQLAIKYSADRAADQSHIKHLSALNENLKGEISKLGDLMEERRVDVENLRRDNEDLRKAQAKLVISLQSEEGTLEGNYGSNKSENLAILQGKIEELEKAKNEYMNQANRNGVELTRRNKELMERIQELDVLKMKYEEAFANYQALNFKLFERLSS